MLVQVDIEVMLGGEAVGDVQWVDPLVIRPPLTATGDLLVEGRLVNERAHQGVGRSFIMIRMHYKRGLLIENSIFSDLFNKIPICLWRISRSLETFFQRWIERLIFNQTRELNTPNPLICLCSTQ